MQIFHYLFTQINVKKMNKVLNDSEILNKILGHKGISANELSKVIGLKSNVIIYHIKSGRNGISAEIANNIHKAYPEFNYDWLRTGKGTMISNTTPNISGVPYYDIDFVGGFNAIFNDHSIKPNFYINFSTFDDIDCWVNFSGESMSPLIAHGDLIALKRINNWTDFIPFGEIYAVVTDQFITIKIITEGTKEGTLTLIPYNKSDKFKSQQIAIKLIKDLFAVRGSVKKFF